MRTVTYHDGTRIEWSGWKPLPWLDAVMGWWVARRGDETPIISTTLGRIYRAPMNQFEQVDATVSPEERDQDHHEPSDAARQRAIDRLRKWLDEMQKVA